MRKLKSVEDKVLAILKDNPEARNDDMLLYVLVCKDCYKWSGTDIERLPFGVVMASYKTMNIPHFESVRRSRQKVQEKHPELDSSPEVKKARHRCQHMYQNYVTS